MPTTQMTFNEILTGRKFKVPSGIVYQKLDAKTSKAIKQVDGTPVSNGLRTTVFYNSKMIMTVVN